MQKKLESEPNKHLKAVKRKKSHFTQGDFQKHQAHGEAGICNHWLGEFSAKLRRANMEASPHVFYELYVGFNKQHFCIKISTDS